MVTRRYVAIVVWGQEIETDTEPRTFLTDPVTRATVARVVSTENRRWANISTVAGGEGPDPQLPPVATNTLAVCYVLLGTTGIISIQMVEENRAPNLADLDARMNENDAWRTRTSSRLDTLATDIAALAARLNGTASMKYLLTVAADLARTKETLNLPDTYTFWGADHFLTSDETDIGHVDNIVKIEEGARFSFEQERNSQLGLMNPLDPGVMNQGNFILPAYVEAPRLEIIGNDSELAISQYTHETISWVLCTKTRTRIRWGTPFVVCMNGYWWWAPAGYDYGTGFLPNVSGGVGGMSPNTDLIYDPLYNILRRGDETYQILDVMDNPNHTVVRLVQFWVDEIVDSYYWQQVVTIDQGTPGSVVSQTFLNSQGGWLTSVDLFFTRIGPSAAVHVLICEVNESGAPDYKRCIARTTVAQDAMRIYPVATKASFLPTYLAKGKRYAIVLQTAGNHFVSLVHNNKFAQGSLFSSTDGVWGIGDLTKDMAFRINCAKFNTNHCTVRLLDLELSGGIAEVDLNFDSTRPPGTTIHFEIQKDGVWMPLGYYENNPLLGLPASLQFRVVLIGTTDEMPGIGVASNSRAYTSRPKIDFVHISTIRTLPSSCNTVYCDFILQGWRGDPHHVFEPRLLVGAGYSNMRSPATATYELDENDPTTMRVHCTWNLAALGGAAVTSYRVRMHGHTLNPLSCFVVSERIDVAAQI